MLILQPVVEFEPWDWVGEQAHNIIGTKQWNKFWDGYLATREVQAVWPGSWHIATPQLEKREVLEQMLKITLESLGLVCFPDTNGEETTDFKDRLTALSGGFILRTSEKVLFTPGCCCDLGDLTYWQDISLTTSNEWQFSAMGHATTEVRQSGDKLEIRENPEYQCRDPIIELIDRQELCDAISVAETEMMRFVDRVMPVLLDIIGNREMATEVAKVLCFVK
ncbi:hypothetical protein MNBD_GAMMA12-2675 [hydrothermal vent metagenome]|uniref:Uncharacterized protein n=1 Tax=hydrothermal vent metagenome TaxID=652676 RepID=A0A3B0Y5F5_9ZZZZ